MAEERKPRSTETRASNEREKLWQPPETLPEPDKQPGYAYRWVRISLLGTSDSNNLSARVREGWELVSTTEQPQLKLFADPTSRFKDAIEVGGLVLCKMADELVEQRSNYYAKRNQQAIEAVDHSYMSQRDPRMPLYKDRKTEVKFGNG